MAKSLQEQLIAAGLVDKKRAQKLDQEKRQQAKKKRQQGKKPVPKTAAQLEAERARVEKIERDKLANKKRDIERAKRAAVAEIADLIKTHKLDRSKGELAHQFVHGRAIKKLFVTKEQHEGLVKGVFVVVKGKKRYELVPNEIGQKVAERDPQALVVTAPSKSEAPVDEQYKDFEVPDDLMW